MLMKIGILYFTTCFHGFGILRLVDPFVRMLHNCQCSSKRSLAKGSQSVFSNTIDPLSSLSGGVAVCRGTKQGGGGGWGVATPPEFWKRGLNAC